MSKLIDLTGQKFNRLLVLEKTESKHNKTRWICQCDCGNTTIVNSQQLKSAEIKSCGCYNLEKLSERTLIDLTGKRFNRLLVLSRGKTVGKSVYWNVICDCGIEKQVLGGHLKSGKIQSCGCFHKESASERRALDITNQRFGILTALESVGKNIRGNIIWKCLCDCGNYKEIVGSHLISGNTKSCGCRARRNQEFGTIYGL